MKLLVAGGREVDAGKTTFATGLVAETNSTGFKPRAGNDYWYDHDDYRHAIDGGRLYGRDARRLAAAGSTDVTVERINPIHRLWRPAPGGAKGLLGREDRAFVVDRVTTAAGAGGSGGSGDGGDEGTAGDEYVTNGGVDIPDSARDALPLDRATTVDSLPEFNDVMATLHKPALEAVQRRIEAADRAVVESYTDIARPISGFEPDAVAVVEPRRARFYRGGRYAKACEVAGGSPTAGRLETPVGHVVELLDPEATVELPPLERAERTDPNRVADTYGPAYDALLATAFV